LVPIAQKSVFGSFEASCLLVDRKDSAGNL
jgi:hypothetical protein